MDEKVEHAEVEEVTVPRVGRILVGVSLALCLVVFGFAAVAGAWFKTLDPIPAYNAFWKLSWTMFGLCVAALAVSAPAHVAARRSRGLRALSRACLLFSVLMTAVAWPKYGHGLPIQVFGYPAPSIRSKVSRVKADMRDIATALEAYMVATNQYIACTLDPDEEALFVSDTPLPTFRIANGRGLPSLTTPVAYMSSMPYDSMSRARGMNFAYWNDREGGWILISPGPDGVFDIAHEMLPTLYDPYRSNPRATDCGTLAQGRTPVAREPVALLKAVAQVRNASCRVPEVSIHSGSVNPMALALARTALGNRRSRLLGVNRLQGREGREAPLRPDEWLRCNEACDGLPSPQNSVREFWDAPLAPAARHGAVAHAVGRDDRDRCSRDV